MPTKTTSSNHSVLHGLLSDALSLGGKIKTEIHDDFLNLREVFSTHAEHIIGEPKLIRPVFSFMRKHEPLFVTHKLAIVSKYDDAIEVLSNEECFSVIDIYAEKMIETTGIFVLGMDDTKPYQQEIAWMRAAVKREDIARLKVLATGITEQQIKIAKASGKIDIVTSLSKLVPTEFVGQYFGAPGPDQVTTQRWMRAIFREIFLDLGNDPTFREQAHNAGKELVAYLTDLVETRVSQRNAGVTLPDDFLSRLVELQADDAELTNQTITRLVGGTIVGTVPTNNKAIVQSLDVLLKHPVAFSLASEAAASGDTELVTQCIFEALRYNPQNPLLLRHCIKDCVVAAGTKREKIIKAGSMVIVGTESAMFDEDKFPQPNEFMADRPMENYIHFGVGQHTCFGKIISTMLWPAVLSPLIQLKNLRQAEGSAGKVKFDGAFPDHWTLAFDTE